MRKYIIFLFCLTSFCFHSFGEQNPVIDSLSRAIKTMPNDTNKVKALNKLGSELWVNWYLDSALIYTEKAELLAEMLRFDIGAAFAKKTIGSIYNDQGNYPKSLAYFQKALEIFEEIGDRRNVALVQNEIGYVYLYQGNYPKSLNYFLKALAIDKEMGNSLAVATDLGNLGSIYSYQGNIAKALEYSEKGLTIDEKTGDKKRIAVSLGNVGNLYFTQGEDLKALNIFFKVLAIDEELGDKYGIAYDYSNIGAIYEVMGDYPKSFEYYFKALTINKEIGNNHEIASTQSSIGNLYIAQKKYNQAEAYLDSALATSLSIGAKDMLRDIFMTKYQLENKRGNYKAALNHYKNSIIYRDSLVNKENSDKIVQAQMNFEFEQQQIAQKAVQDKKDAAAKAESQKQKVIRNGFIIGFILMLLLVFFVFRSYRQKKQANIIISQQKDKVEEQKAIVDAKNKDITDSITYASRIQKALLTTDEHLSSQFKEQFVLFKPRDIVSGDFYWNFSRGGLIHIACCDCTGHGVPGAFMSLLNISLLNEAVVERKIKRPDLVFNDVRENIIKALNPIGSEIESKDGMDAVFCTIDLKKKFLQAACANNLIWIISEDGALRELKADKMPVGAHHSTQAPFTLKEENLQKGDCIYLFTDGYVDQFGGLNGKKFKHKQLKELLIANAQKAMEEQKAILDAAFEKWRGNEEQVDDVCIIGIRV